MLENESYLKKITLLFFHGDLLSKGFKAELETMEVGSLGHFFSVAIHSIHAILAICCSLSKRAIF